MSRIGKMPIEIPEAVTVTVDGLNVRVKGPKGELEVLVHEAIKIVLEADQKRIVVDLIDKDSQESRALWGLMRQLIANAIAGVQTPFQKSLEFIGVGYKVAVSGKEVKMEVGYSHPVVFTLSEGIEAKLEKNVLTLSGIDKQLVGEMAAQIRRIRPPEPYKGKGIKYTTEVVRRKAGKTAMKGA